MLLLRHVHNRHLTQHKHSFVTYWLEGEHSKRNTHQPSHWPATRGQLLMRAVGTRLPDDDDVYSPEPIAGVAQHTQPFYGRALDLQLSMRARQRSPLISLPDVLQFGAMPHVPHRQYKQAV